MDPPKPQSPQYALKKEVIYGAPAPAGLSDTTIMHQSKLLDRSFAWPSCVLPAGLTGPWYQKCPLITFPLVPACRFMSMATSPAGRVSVGVVRLPPPATAHALSVNVVTAC